VRNFFLKFIDSSVFQIIGCLVIPLGDYPEGADTQAAAQGRKEGARFPTIPKISDSVQRSLSLNGGGSSKNVIEPVSMPGLQAALVGAGPDTLIVIDFGASWCGPCQQVAPQFDALADANAPLLDDEDYVSHASVIFIKVDVDILSEAAADFDVEALPTFVFQRGGKEVSRITGANIHKVEEMVNRHLKR